MHLYLPLCATHVIKPWARIVYNINLYKSKRSLGLRLAHTNTPDSIHVSHKLVKLEWDNSKERIEMKRWRSRKQYQSKNWKIQSNNQRKSQKKWKCSIEILQIDLTQVQLHHILLSLSLELTFHSISWS
jgi:isochorismate synthase EntC